MSEFIKSLLASTALVTVVIFAYNQYQEWKHLRISCLSLLIEINRHKTWLTILLQDLAPEDRKNALDVISTADFVNNDWNKIKFDAMFTRISAIDFNVIALHYNEMFSFQKSVEKCYQRNEAIDEKSFAVSRLEICKQAYNIVYKLAGKPVGYELEK
ncbi:MAG: hypothetical protein K0Q87_4881 [Neobacillus sp.]|jgi:hypothetical protein|nr:hypothetical protein [Neobacillus sp.]